MSASESSLVQAELTRITRAVCSGFLGIEPEPDNRVEADIGDVLAGSIRYNGEWSATLRVEFGLFEAVVLAHRLLGPDADTPSVTVVSSRTPNLDEPPTAQQAFAFGGGRLLVSFRAKSSGM
jgi:hypothetical protein